MTRHDAKNVLNLLIIIVVLAFLLRASNVGAVGEPVEPDSEPSIAECFPAGISDGVMFVAERGAGIPLEPENFESFTEVEAEFRPDNPKGRYAAAMYLATNDAEFVLVYITSEDDHVYVHAWSEFGAENIAPSCGTWYMEGDAFLEWFGGVVGNLSTQADA